MPALEPKPTNPTQEDRKWDVLPPQTVFALVDHHAHADVAVQRLTKAGIARDRIEILSGEEGVRRLEPDAARAQGVQGFISAVMQEITDETKVLEIYGREMREGRPLIAVCFAGGDKRKAEEERATITALLLDSGGAKMSYTSNWTLTKIVDPEGAV